MPRFSANLGFLWTDRSLSEAVTAAAQAGFDAVECHWPYDTDPHLMRAALQDTELPLLGLNTSRGDTQKGEFGLSAIPGRQSDARAAIDQAVDYANLVDAKAIHVMAGVTEGPDAEAQFDENLRYACDQASDRTILIEPINSIDVPGYFLSRLDHAAKIIERVGRRNLRLMFDCYHTARMGQDVCKALTAYRTILGHVQIAGVPHRGAPDTGVLDYAPVFETLDRIGWSDPIGAEYRTDGPTSGSLAWLERSR